MKPTQFSLRRIMIATGVLGGLLGSMLRSPHDLSLIIFLLAGLIVLIIVVYSVSRMPPRVRLAVEIAVVLILLAISAVIWTPPFYTAEERRCRDLARVASEASGDSPEISAALDAEAAWFSRRAAALQRRGLWLGLTRGPSTRDDGRYPLSTAELVHVLTVGTHEARLLRLLKPDPPTP